MRSIAETHLICLTILAIARIIEEVFTRYEAAEEETSKEEEVEAEAVAVVDVGEGELGGSSRRGRGKSWRGVDSRKWRGKRA